MVAASTLAAVAWLCAACTSAADDDSQDGVNGITGTGGQLGTGGVVATGTGGISSGSGGMGAGAIGSGGVGIMPMMPMTGSGGSSATGTGGMDPSGAAGVGSGGMMGSGGMTGSGGMMGSGGMTGSGGTMGSGGMSGSGTGGSGMASGATFTEVYAIISMKCGGGLTGCHVMGSSGSLRMPDKATAFMNLVGVDSSKCPGEKRVVAGDADSSLLIKAVEGTACIDRMPDNRDPLADDEIMKMRDWISAGAMND